MQRVDYLVFKKKLSIFLLITVCWSSVVSIFHKFRISSRSSRLFVFHLPTMTSNGKATCKEVCSNCKCTIVEKPMVKKEEKKEEKKKEQCVATIVGVLQLPENFCCPQQKQEEKKEDDFGGQEEAECVDVYRDLGECLQKCLVQSSKNGKQKNSGLECDIGTCGSNGTANGNNWSNKTSKSKNGC